MTARAVTVVFAACNHGATLRAVLDALESTDWPDLAIVAVDCGSSDGGLALLRARAARQTGVPFRLLELPGAGRSTALNAGFAAAGRRDVVRLHADVVPDDPRWLHVLHAALQRHPDCGVLGAKIVLAGGRIQTCGRDLVRGLGIVPEGSDRRWLEGDGEETSRPTEVDGVSGELCWIRREVLTATGGLDPNYDPVFGDDDDFCLLARWHGFRVMVEPAVRAVHYAPRRSTTTCMQPNEPSGLLAESIDARIQLQLAHQDYFQAKWGFDPSAPDLHEVRRRYGHTRICWRIGARLTETLPAVPAVDVCFVTWNSMAVLPRMLDHLAATRWPDVTVWVTDNGSTDGTLEHLAARGPDFPFPIHVQRMPANVGVAPALNLAFQQGKAPIVARLDDDTVVTPEWLERLVPRFHQRPYAGVVSPKVLHDNDGQGLQNGPLRLWPGPFTGIGTTGAHLVDGLVRVVSQRGCCNLYRRSVFAEVGWLDVRYAPSQFDEWDHHLAVCNAGYEVLYDGSVAVRHLLTAGRMATPSSLANYNGNLLKTQGKWGPDHFRALDRGIDLSIDGRCLPPDGDTSALRARLPAVPEGPPQGPARDPAERHALTTLARRRALLRHPAGPLAAFWREQVALGEEALADGLPLAMAMVMKVMDLLPHDARALAFVARYRHSDGDGPAATRTARWALRLAPEDAGVRELAAPALAPVQPPVLLPRPAPGRCDVLLLPPLDPSDDDATTALHEAIAVLDAAGLSWRVARELVPEAHGERLVHAFGLADASTQLPRLQALRAQLPAARFVLSPLLADPGAADWLDRVFGSRFHASDAELRTLCRAAVEGRIEVPGANGRRVASQVGDGVAYERACVALVDALVVPHDDAAHWLQRRLGSLPPTMVHTPVLVPAACGAAADDVPRGAVLALGPRDVPGNHLPLVLATQGLDLCVALCGRHAHPFAEGRTRQRGGDRVLWLPPRGLAGQVAAMARSAVFVWLPANPTSFTLPLHAAVAGCELVLARGIGAERIFGGNARYVDPLDLDELRAAITAGRGAWPATQDAAWRRQLAADHAPVAARAWWTPRLGETTQRAAPARRQVPAGT